MDEERGVAAVIDDLLRAKTTVFLTSSEIQRPLGAPPVFLQRLALPCEDRHAAGPLDSSIGPDGDGGGGVVLGAEDIARTPTHLRSQSRESLDEHGRLHRHVQAAGDAKSGQRMGLGVLLAHGHESGHLLLGEVDLLAAPLGQREIADFEFQCGGFAISLARLGGLLPGYQCLSHVPRWLESGFSGRWL